MRISPVSYQNRNQNSAQKTNLKNQQTAFGLGYDDKIAVRMEKIIRTALINNNTNILTAISELQKCFLRVKPFQHQNGCMGMYDMMKPENIIPIDSKPLSELSDLDLVNVLTQYVNKHVPAKPQSPVEIPNSVAILDDLQLKTGIRKALLSNACTGRQEIAELEKRSLSKSSK